MTCTCSLRVKALSSSHASRGEHAVFEHAALDELTRLQRVVRLLDEVVADAVLADVNDHVEVIGKAAQIRALFAA